MYKLESFLTSGPRHPRWRVPWATIFYAFQHNENGRNERLFNTMLFKLIKKWKRLFFYQFNISFALISCKWKMVLNNLTRGKPNYFLFAISNTFIYITWFYILTVFYISQKCYKLKASVLQYIIKYMSLLFNYLKISDCFIAWNDSFAKNWILNTENFS